MTLRLAEALATIWLLVLWTCGIRMLLGSIANPFTQFSLEAMIFAAFFALWTLFGILCMFWFVWRCCGCQTVARQGSNIVVASAIGPIKIAPETVLNLEAITNLRIEQKVTNVKGIRGREYIIICDYSEDKRILARFLSEEQAQLLLSGPLRDLVSRCN